MNSLLRVSLGLAVAMVVSSPMLAVSAETELKIDGKWVGKWDRTWPVQFTLSSDAKTGEVSVLYEWEDRVGAAMSSEKYVAKLEGNVLKMKHLEITFSEDDPNLAGAYGKFGTSRTAILRRQGK